MPKQELLKKLAALREVLERLQRTDTTLYESMTHDVEEAMTLTDECIEELSDDAGTEAAK